MVQPELRDTGQPPSLAPRPYQILSLTGGGYRGLYSAAILIALEREAGAPLHQVFDMIAGTSIGGILATGLSSGVSASDLFEAFLSNGKAIFPEFHRIRGIPIFPRIRTGAFRGRYSATGLANVIDAILAKSGKTQLGDTLTTLLVPAIDVLSHSPVIFERGVNEQSIALRDIALATSAAPTYFPEHAIGDRLFADGGLVANAPDIVAIARAVARGHALDTIRMVSLGTVGTLGAGAARKARSPGYIRDGKRLFELTLQAQQSLALTLAREVLGSRHIRLDKTLSAAEAEVARLDMVDSKAVATLRNVADKTIAQALSDHSAQFRDILNRRPAL